MRPLTGQRVVEFAGYGAVPFAGMMLADLGAEIIRVERPTQPDASMARERRFEGILRGRRSIVVDMKDERGRDVVRCLVDRADAVIEGHRPGVMERLGLGPDHCFERNPRLVYGRVSGWGQAGPLARSAGHDINFLSLTGALHAIGERTRAPVPPLALVGDMGGGGMSLALGVCAALVERERSGRGQVVEASIFEGAAALMTLFYGFRSAGAWNDERESNRLDGGAPYYRVYECADGKHMAVGALEDPFFEALCVGLEVEPFDLVERTDPAHWPAMTAVFSAAFKTRTRDEWRRVFDRLDACVTPVLSMEEAPLHEHARARGAFVTGEASTVPAPTPRFSRSVSPGWAEPEAAGQSTVAILEELGLSDSDVNALIEANVVCATNRPGSQ